MQYMLKVTDQSDWSIIKDAPLDLLPIIQKIVKVLPSHWGHWPNDDSEEDPCALYDYAFTQKEADIFSDFVGSDWIKKVELLKIESQELLFEDK